MADKGTSPKKSSPTPSPKPKASAASQQSPKAATNSPMKPTALLAKLSSHHNIAHQDSVLSLDEAGLHVNHTEGHHQHLGGAAGSTHSYEEEEAEAFTLFVNEILKDDESVKHLIPLGVGSSTGRRDLFTKHEDGLILLRLLERAVPGLLRGKTVHSGDNINIFKKNENLNLFLGLAAEEGCHLVNIGATDISTGKETAVLSILWQLFRMLLVANVTIKNFPELHILLRPNETIEDLLHRSPEYVLLRWMKYHFEADAPSESFPCTDFGPTMRDPLVFLRLLHNIDASLTYEEPQQQLSDPSAPAVTESTKSNAELTASRLELAKQAIANAHRLGVRSTATAADLLCSAASVKIAFAAQIFSTRHGLPSPPSDIIAAVAALPSPRHTHNRLVEEERADRAAREAERAERAARDAERLQQLVEAGNKLLERAAELMEDIESNVEESADTFESLEDSDSVNNAKRASNDSVVNQLSNSISNLFNEIETKVKLLSENSQKCTEYYSNLQALKTELTVSIDVKDAQQTLTKLESEFQLISDIANSCKQEREHVEKLISHLRVAHIQLRIASAVKDCESAQRTASELLDRVKALQVVYIGNEVIESALVACQSSVTDIADIVVQCKQMYSDLSAESDSKLDDLAKSIDGANASLLRVLKILDQARAKANAATSEKNRLDSEQQQQQQQQKHHQQQQQHQQQTPAESVTGTAAADSNSGNSTSNNNSISNSNNKGDIDDEDDSTKKVQYNLADDSDSDETQNCIMVPLLTSLDESPSTSLWSCFCFFY